MRDGGRVAHDVANIRLVGGTPAIDFVNSIHDHTSEFAQDYLLDGAAYLDWCVRAGVLTAAERRLVAEREADEVVAGDVPMLRRNARTLHLRHRGAPSGGERRRRPGPLASSVLGRPSPRLSQPRPAGPRCAS